MLGFLGLVLLWFTVVYASQHGLTEDVKWALQLSMIMIGFETVVSAIEKE